MKEVKEVVKGGQNEGRIEPPESARVQCNHDEKKEM